MLLARGSPRDAGEARSIAAAHGFALLEADAADVLARHADGAGRADEAARLRAEAALARGGCRAGLPGAFAAAPASAVAPSLSRAERAVAKLLALGLSNKEIGKRLFISPATVRTHLHRIFRKLGVRLRVEAALLVRGGAV